MAELTVQQIATSGITPTLAAAAAGGDTFANNGKTYFEAKNGSGSPVTATIASQVTDPPAGCAAEDLEIVIPATTGHKKIGPFDKGAFNNSTGQVEITYTAVTTVTVGAFKL